MISLGLYCPSKSDHLNLRRDFIHLLGSMEAPQPRICTSFQEDCSAFLSAGSGITWQFIWRWNQMKIPSVSSVLCNWIRLKYVAVVGVAISIDSSWCYPVLLQKSLIRMRSSLESQAKCRAFYCCIEENTLDLLDVGVLYWHALMWTLGRKSYLHHQQHYCDLSLHNMSLCCCVECSYSNLENFVARVSHSCEQVVFCLELSLILLDPKMLEHISAKLLLLPVAVSAEKLLRFKFYSNLLT